MPYLNKVPNTTRKAIFYSIYFDSFQSQDGGFPDKGFSYLSITLYFMIYISPPAPLEAQRAQRIFFFFYAAERPA
jgi:hypothetical protein